MTYVVDATRALFAGTYPADVVAQGLAGAAVVAALGPVVRGARDAPVELRPSC